MACGVPSVASRLPGATDIVIDDGRTGVLVAPGDVDALAAALHDLLINRERAAAIGEAARRHIAANFSAAQTAAGWLDAYRTVTAAA